MSNFICFLILGIEGCHWTSTANDYGHILLLDPRPAEGPVKSPLSVCLSVCPSVRQFGIFLRDGSLVFTDSWHDGKYLEYLKTDRALFSRKIYVYPNLGKKCPKQGSLVFWKILSLVFLGNNLKWKLILLLIFQHQSHIWQNSSSRVVDQNALSQSNCRIL